MRGKNKSISLASTFFILAIIAFSICSVQHFQTARPTTQSPKLIPPPPSAPLWTYTTGGYVRAVAVSEDGSTIVAGSYDKKIYVFDKQSNTTVWTYTTSDVIYSVAVSANGSTIVEGGDDYCIRVFRRQSNTPVWTYKSIAPIYSVAVSADGNTIVAGGQGSSIYVFGRQSNTTVWKYTWGWPVFSVAVSANGSTIVAGAALGPVLVFGRQSNTTIWHYFTSSVIERSVAVSADGNTIAAGGTDDYVRVFGRQNNATLWNYNIGGDVVGVAVSRDGTTIAAGGYDDYFRVFGRTSNATLVQHNTGANIYKAIALSSDGSAIACGGTGASHKAYLFSRSLGLLWDYSVGGAICADTTSGPAVGISGDGSLVAYGCDDDKLYVFRYDTVAPVLGSPSVLPSSPIGGQSVNISISVADNVAVSTVTLYYKEASAGSWSSVAMSIVGAVYKATIGPFAATSSVAFYVVARDASENNASSPVDAPTSYHIFAVGSPPGIEWTSVLIGAGLGAVIAIIVSFVMMRGKRGRR